jgi:hypothetical protein
LAEPEARTTSADATEPRDRRARYDRRSGQIVIDITNGGTLAFPARLGQGLADATRERPGPRAATEGAGGRATAPEA